jgi:hypothetical protein
VTAWQFDGPALALVLVLAAGYLAAIIVRHRAGCGRLGDLRLARRV